MASLKEGLTKSAPPPSDSSTKWPSAKSVDAEPTRSTTAPTPKTLGPRSA